MLQERRTSPNHTVAYLAFAASIAIAMIAAVTILVVTGHSSDAAHFSAVLGTAILNLAAVFGVGLKLRNTSQQVAQATRIAADTNTKTSETHEALSNGFIPEKLDQYLESRGLVLMRKDLSDDPSKVSGGLGSPPAA